jgi:hypothetical protein
MACLDYLNKVHEVTFKVRSEDISVLEDLRNSLKDRFDGLINIKFLADEALGPGDLIMETDGGRLDATLKNRREKVMSVLREAILSGQTTSEPLTEGKNAKQDSPTVGGEVEQSETEAKGSDIDDGPNLKSPLEPPSLLGEEKSLGNGNDTQS